MTEYTHHPFGTIVREQRSKRAIRRDRYANDVCVELRRLIAQDGVVNGTNGSKLVDLLLRWKGVALKSQIR